MQLLPEGTSQDMPEYVTNTLKSDGSPRYLWRHFSRETDTKALVNTPQEGIEDPNELPYVVHHLRAQAGQPLEVDL